MLILPYGDAAGGRKLQVGGTPTWTTLVSANGSYLSLFLLLLLLF